MFTTFTGNSRRPRQVNLSGRTSNPFAPTGAVKGQPAVLASAQQDRIARQRERERHSAAIILQNAWRGYSCREKLRKEFRIEWDAHENRSQGTRERSNSQTASYDSEDESLLQVRRLIRYASPNNDGDVERLLRWVSRHQKGVQQSRILTKEDSWNKTYHRIQRLVLYVLHRRRIVERPDHISRLLAALMFIIGCAPHSASADSQCYYHALSLIAASISPKRLPKETIRNFLQLLVLPLNVLDEGTVQVYEHFTFEFMTTPNLRINLDAIDGLEFLAEHLNYRILESVLARRLDGSQKSWSSERQSAEADLWLLAYFIYIRRYTFKHSFSEDSFSSDYVSVVSALLSSAATHYDLDQLRSRPEWQCAPTERKAVVDVDNFLQTQISSLINETDIRNLLSGLRTSILANAQELSEADKSRATKYARYALNLLQTFPERGDDIRMWLFLGHGSFKVQNGENIPVSPMRFFWKAAQETSVFRDIQRDSRLAIGILRGLIDIAQFPGDGKGIAISSLQKKLEDDWSLIAIFLELYSFVLRIMDDEEFFSPLTSVVASNPSSAATRSNALPLEEVRDLSTFLKHLGFTMYFSGADIFTVSSSTNNTIGIKQAFTSLNNPSAKVQASEADRQIDSSIILSIGFSMDYLKKLVTGVLRVIYERDSRRKFTSKDHWLMKSRLEMKGFIPAVVYEEEKSHLLQELDSDDYAGEAPFPEEDSMIGAGRTERTSDVERVNRQQNRAIRKRDTELVTPRLEILQNMPFLIDFHTRVQIFREFIHQDQVYQYA